MRSELVIRFDFGTIVPVGAARRRRAGRDRRPGRALLPHAGRDARRGHDAPSPSSRVRPGERVPFVLTWFPSHERAAGRDRSRAGARPTPRSTGSSGRGRCTHGGDYHDEIHQSLLVLKALTYAPTGGIVAAPTTSLPEHVGGVRNWDYRFCWLRDATLTLLAMLEAGYRDEARGLARSGSCARSRATRADVQIMYGIAGERRLDERELDWLPGYEGSQPVRVGNAASEQLQLDVYGEVLDALYQTRAHGAPPTTTPGRCTRKLLEWLEDGWRQRGRGDLGGARARSGTSRTRR